MVTRQQYIAGFNMEYERLMPRRDRKPPMTVKPKQTAEVESVVYHRQTVKNKFAFKGKTKTEQNAERNKKIVGAAKATGGVLKKAFGFGWRALRSTSVRRGRRR